MTCEPLGRRRWRLATAFILLQFAVYPVAASGHRFGPWRQAVSVDPERSGINTTFNDGCPIESPDGRHLFFASNRTGDLDIWVSAWIPSRRHDDGAWSAPEKQPAPLNTPASEFCPTPLRGNWLLFVSTRSNICGGSNNADIYLTRRHPVRGWTEPEHLGCNVNSAFEEFSPSIVETAGGTQLFFSSNREDGFNHKIYVSTWRQNGTWGEAVPVAELNALGASDARPSVRHDGLEIVFDSTRDGGPPQIYTASRRNIFKPWSSVHALDSRVNQNTAAQTRASFSRDGKRLYFGSTRNGGIGSDIFVSTRSGPGPK